ncbi:beta-lactamase family protein [Gluconobacter sp. R75690]|uniref:serine hydrolase domain-containing protein n=1 Tax=Gluconobacter TaxID=441 RepID=UPI00188D9EF2|nr:MULTISPECIES: serine hydrolase domain-containing protein [unclassified Gluconobacter]MBF0851446.1 beta-lactamase family protein [Gluconobacter sp. R75690]MBF0880073.1 beta-lactamase family protein [Gluconobacter sp. R75828]
MRQKTETGHSAAPVSRRSILGTTLPAAAWLSSRSSASAAEVSTSSARTTAIDSVLQNAVHSGSLVGATVLVSERGKIVYERAFGSADREAGIATQTGTLFRLASMTKPVICVAALALMEQGKLSLDAPVTQWLPDFRPALPDGRQPVITIRHLMTHTAGLGYGFLEPETGPYHRKGISDGLDHARLTLQENIARIATVPLLFEPGTAWHYSLAIDVLGGVIERVTGLTLPTAIRTLVTGPLGLTSLAFSIPQGTPIAVPYADGGTGGAIRMTDPFQLKFGPGHIVYSPSRAFDPAAWPSGGVGMVGTAGDYLRFAEAIRTGGSGVLKPESVAAMTTNAIGTLPVGAAGPGFGWGLGVAVLTDPTRAGLPLSPGSWNWSGLYGTGFWVDPARELSAVALTNTAVAGMSGSFPRALRHAVYTA